MTSPRPGIWNEQDPLTRAKLLIAFGLTLGGEGDDVAMLTVHRQLQELAVSLPAQDARRVVAFVDWYEKNTIGHGKTPGDRNNETGLGNYVRETFKTE